MHAGWGRWISSRESRWTPTFGSVNHASPGTRIDVATIVGAIAAGEAIDEVEKEYELTHEQVMDALRYAAHVAAHLPPAVKQVS